jgi:hypothetical protein
MAREKTEQQVIRSDDVATIREDGSAVAEALPEFARPDNDTLREIRTLDDAAAYLRSQGIELTDAVEALGTGWVRPEGQEANEAVKRTLVENPCVFMLWILSPGDYFRHGVRTNFATIFVMTNSGDRYIITDGSTGLSMELEAYTKKTGQTGGLVLKRGLRKSDYKLDAKALSEGQAVVVSRDFEGATADATTFYLNV